MVPCTKSTSCWADRVIGHGAHLKIGDLRRDDASHWTAGCLQQVPPTSPSFCRSKRRRDSCWLLRSAKMNKPGILIEIPGFGAREIRTIVTDYTGTLSCGGRLVAGVRGKPNRPPEPCGYSNRQRGRPTHRCRCLVRLQRTLLQYHRATGWSLQFNPADYFSVVRTTLSYGASVS
jgi:hypothetical protein